MTEKIIIKPSVQKRFDSFMAHGRVLFFSAPCGFGKTVLADALLHGRNVLRQSAADPDCAIPPSAQDWDILLIDDLQLMQEEAGQQALCELIRSSPERRFVLLSRGVPPGCLTAFQYTGLMTSTRPCRKKRSNCFSTDGFTMMLSCKRFPPPYQSGIVP